MAKTATTKQPQKTEEILWDTAVSLRGHVAAANYKYIVLNLIFLKFASDKFDQRRQQLIDIGQGDYVDNKVFYAKVNAFYLTEKSRWSYIAQKSKQNDIAVKIDTALADIEKNNAALKGALSSNYFSSLDLDISKLSALIDAINNLDTIADPSQDIIGRVYEYFIGKFAVGEGKRGGEYYTPICIVKLIAEMIEPYEGKIYDPCCGSGGMFVQSVKFTENHQGNKKNISVYGQEYNSTTYKLAKINLAIRGISANFGDKPADTFNNDQHKDLKADYIMANPPFNQEAWRTADELIDDPRWAGYNVPPANNANYAWILHIISKLSANGTGGLVMANGTMSTGSSGEGDIRRQIINNDLVDCIISLPGQLFYTVQIPVCLWFVTRNKKARKSKRGEYRSRKGETLFIDARNLGSMIDRTHKELTQDDIIKIAQTYHAWRNEKGNYQDIAGFCKSATVAEIAENDYVLTPGRYVGMAAEDDDMETFHEKMAVLSATLHKQMRESAKLDKEIQKNLSALGYKTD